MDSVYCVKGTWQGGRQMISAGEIRVYSYLNISRVADLSMGI